MSTWAEVIVAGKGQHLISRYSIMILRLRGKGWSGKLNGIKNREQ